MIAIKNADGTLVPVSEGHAGISRSVALSLVHSNQKRAEIQLFEIEPAVPGEHPPLQAGQEPFGVLVLKKLPENPFGEVEISATIDVDQDNRVHILAEAEGIKPVSAVFDLPGQALPGAALDDLADFGLADSLDLPPPDDADDAADVFAGAAPSSGPALDGDMFGDLPAPAAEEAFDLDSLGGTDTGDTAEAPFDLDAEDLDLGSLDLGEAVESAPEMAEPEEVEPEAAAIGTAPDDDFLAGSLPSFDDDLFGEATEDRAEPSGETSVEEAGFAENPETEEVPVAADEGFLDDPDNTDWGFDELANPADEDDVGESPESAVESGAAQSGTPDLSFGEESLKLEDEGDFDMSGDFPELDDTVDDGGFDDRGSEPEPAAAPAGSGRAATPVARSAEPQRFSRPAKGTRDSREKRGDVRPVPTTAGGTEAGALPGLMKASIILFAISLVELGTYLVLRFTIFP